MTPGFFSDEDKLDYPAADRLVADWLQRHEQSARTTSVDVLKWSDYPNSHHNRKRVYDALTVVCERTDDNWAGRTVFRVPADTINP